MTHGVRKAREFILIKHVRLTWQYAICCLAALGGFVQVQFCRWAFEARGAGVVRWGLKNNGSCVRDGTSGERDGWRRVQRELILLRTSCGRLAIAHSPSGLFRRVNACSKSLRIYRQHTLCKHHFRRKRKHLHEIDDHGANPMLCRF